MSSRHPYRNSKKMQMVVAGWSPHRRLRRKRGKRVLLVPKLGSKKASNRLLGQVLTESGIRINNTVTVSPYGGANFSSINEAVAFAPNNSVVDDGYFVIYAKQGYYQEYIVVPKNKKNIMLIGDGINATVVTGNRNVIDGYTTFNSATF
ncbi:hypothetical protein MIMGU_mgv1a0257352mg, partial [Erythranthe guttata]